VFEAANQFFPTGKTTARKVWAKVKELRRFDPGTILDPSAGKGDLLDYSALERVRGRNRGTSAIEIDPDLRTILREKGYTVLGSDFLEWSEPVEFDAIVMNPPFNRGVDHVLHAWKFVAPKGCLVALLNKETIANPYTKERQRLLELIDLFGGFEDLGQAFKGGDVERPCDVEVVMVWLAKPFKALDTSEFVFTGDFSRATDEEIKELEFNPLAATDAIDNLVAQYRVCLRVLKAQHQAQVEMKYHLESIDSATGVEDLIKVMDFDDNVRRIKKRFWWALFRMTRMSEISTSSYRKTFSDFVESQIYMAFDRANILEAINIFLQGREQIMIDSICSVFDRATQFHPSNKVHPEGWKTNAGWKMNKKIINPTGVYWNEFLGWSFGQGKYRCAFLDDLEEVLCWLAGVPLDHENMTSIKISNSKFPPGEWIERQHFDIKIFRKGTVHIRFRDEYLIDDFNAIAAKGKMWIGGEDH
jgi:hypothetical protein